MICLTRLNRVPIMLNSDLIEHVEVTPDTVITLTTGHTFMVLESAQEILDKVIAFRRAIYERMCQCPTLRELERQRLEAASGEKRQP
ncbi:MAG: flagellar FlbD family protein [Bryobacteraceae bacterium]